MRKLMTTHMQRQLSLLEYIFSSPYLTATDICRYFNFTQKTLANDILAINVLISPVTIARDSKGYYSVEFPNNCNLEYIYSCFLKNSLEFKIITKIIFRDDYSYATLSEEFFISESSMRRTVKKMNSILRCHGFTISSPPFSLVGDENKILNFMVYLFQETFIDSKQLLKKEEYDFMNDLYTLIQPIISGETNYPDNERFNFYIFSNILRIQQGKFTKRKELPTNESIVFPENLNRQFKKLFQIDTFSIVYEQASYIFLNDFYAINFDTLLNKMKQSEQISNTVKAINNMVGSLNTFFDIPNNLDQSELILKIYNCTTLTYGNNYIIFDKYQFFVDSAYKRHPFIKKIVNECLEPIVSYTTYDKMAEFIYILLTNMNGLSEALYRFQPKLKVLLLFDTDIAHLTLMKKELEFLLPSMLDVKLPISMNLNNIKSDLIDSDIILTNNPFFEKSSVQTYCFSIYPTVADIKKLSDFYSKWVNEKFYSKDIIS